MEISILVPDEPTPVERACALSMVVKSFKGRRDVEVHLFRHHWDPAEESAYDWDMLLDRSDLETGPGDEDSARRFVLESFTPAERDRIVDFLREQYTERLNSVSSCALSFPVPVGIRALSDFQPGKSIGIIEFDRIPSYNLGIPMRGLYDLSQHPPLVQGGEAAQ